MMHQKRGSNIDTQIYQNTINQKNHIRTWLGETQKNNRNPFELEDLNNSGFGVTPDGRTVCIDYGWANIADFGFHLDQNFSSNNNRGL